jgi:hypothetical protein
MRISTAIATSDRMLRMIRTIASSAAMRAASPITPAEPSTRSDSSVDTDSNSTTQIIKRRRRQLIIPLGAQGPLTIVKEAAVNFKGWLEIVPSEEP